jgi:hypothetical protein
MAKGSEPAIKPHKKKLPLPTRITKSIKTDPVKDKRPIGVILEEWTKANKLRTDVMWSTMSDEEIKKVTTTKRANALGVPYAYAERLVEKISNLIKARTVRRIATYQNGKLIRLSQPIRRIEPKR